MASVMVKEFSGKELKTPRGSLRSLRVSLPVLTTVVVTLRFSNPSTSILGAEDLTVKLGTVETAGAAETVTAEETRAARKVRGEGENIVVKVVKGIEETAPMTTVQAWVGQPGPFVCTGEQQVWGMADRHPGG